MSRLYVETLIRADPAELWQRTQDTAAHARWDARFSAITVLSERPRRFRYTTLGVSGTGVCAGERNGPGGAGVSALRFASASPLSPIRHGSGYWRYLPGAEGVRFITGYDYEPGWGGAADLLVRPLMGWLTAWSFDRLRLWLEDAVPPGVSRNRALAHTAARAALVVAAARFGGRAAAAAAVLMAVLPPPPGVPAARRCLRRPPAPLETL